MVSKQIFPRHATRTHAPFLASLGQRRAERSTQKDSEREHQLSRVVLALALALALVVVVVGARAMGRAPNKAEDKNVEIYLRVKPTPKASRNVTFDLVRTRRR